MEKFTNCTSSGLNKDPNVKIENRIRWNGHPLAPGIKNVLAHFYRQVTFSGCKLMFWLIKPKPMI